MGVTVSSDNAVSVSVATDGAISVAVAQSQQGGVNAYGGIGPTILVNGTVTNVVGTIGINPFVAGPNITITTAGGNITVSGVTPPVLSVQGKTGHITLAAVDIAAIAENHTHSTSQIANLAGYVQSYGNVLSVQGKTGSVTLVASDINAAGALHTHATSEVSGLTATIKSFANVLSVQGKTGTVVLSFSNITSGTVNANQVRWGAPGSVENPTGVNYAYLTNTPVIGLVVPDGEDGSNGLRFATIGEVPSIQVASSLGNDHLAADATYLDNEISYINNRLPVNAQAYRGVVTLPGIANPLRTSSGFVYTLNGCTGTVSIQAGANISVSASGAAITIAAASNTNAVQAAIWPALILGG